MLVALASLSGWAQSVVAPEFTFEGDNLVMTTTTANASIFYAISDLSDLLDETVDNTTSALIDLPNYYQQPIEVKRNAVIKAVALVDEGGTTLSSDTTTLAYGYTLWVELSTAITRGHTVYDAANGNAAVDQTLLDNLQWAVEEGEMIYGSRGSAPYFEAEHFAYQINDYCDQIEAIIGTVAPSITTEPYAVLSNDNTVLTFYFDEQKDARGGMSVGPFTWDNVTVKPTTSWYDYRESIVSVIFDASFADCNTITSTTYWFNGCSNLSSISGMSNLKTENVTEMEAMFFGCSSLVNIDLTGFNTESLQEIGAMFYGCSNLLFLDLGSFNTTNVTVTSGMFTECSSLAAIVAGNANIPAEEYANIGNPNLLVYVNEASLAPQGIQNVVISGTAPEIILTDAASGNNNWYCPQPFIAEKISYTRTFSQETQIGVSRGWETIALPFNVQTITHADRGEISPFGSSDSKSNYHFWLRRLTDNGLQSVRQIEANTAYLISMPNSSEYSEEYNLAGAVTFSAENADIPETNVGHDEYGNYAMAPVFERWEAQQYVYALNVGEVRGGYPEGSVFEQNYRELRPFEAFTKHLTDGGSRFLSLDDLNNGNTTGLESLTPNPSPMGEGNYYDLNGRRVLYPSKGVFIQNGQKVVIK